MNSDWLARLELNFDYLTEKWRATEIHRLEKELGAAIKRRFGGPGNIFCEKRFIIDMS